MQGTGWGEVPYNAHVTAHRFQSSKHKTTGNMQGTGKEVLPCEVWRQEWIWLPQLVLLETSNEWGPGNLIVYNLARSYLRDECPKRLIRKLNRAITDALYCKPPHAPHKECA
eukprot:1157111-Pelagomonas_calceolata.AAC.13